MTKTCGELGHILNENGECGVFVPNSPPLSPRLTLPIDSEARKGYPMFDGCIAYFPAALAGVSRISKLGNDKHNPGEALHHARGKSMDHKNCIIRHLIDVADLLAKGDTSQQTLDEVSCLAWRALAYSQELHEQLGAAPLAPGARK